MPSRKGRKRKTGVKRHPGGKVVQPAQEKRQVERAAEARATVMQARERLHGASLGKSHIGAPEAGSAIGRAFLRREISTAQHTAARRFEEVTRAYHRAVGAQGVGSAGDLERVHGYDGGDGDEEGYVERCNAARRAYQDMRRALMDVSGDARDGFVFMALEGWILEDIEMHDLLPSARIGLNALVRLWNIQEPQERAA
jgi:hypothetical protein